METKSQSARFVNTQEPHASVQETESEGFLTSLLSGPISWHHHPSSFSFLSSLCSSFSLGPCPSCPIFLGSSSSNLLVGLTTTHLAGLSLDLCSSRKPPIPTLHPQATACFWQNLFRPGDRIPICIIFHWIIGALQAVWYTMCYLLSKTNEQTHKCQWHKETKSQKNPNDKISVFC